MPSPHNQRCIGVLAFEGTLSSIHFSLAIHHQSMQQFSLTVYTRWVFVLCYSVTADSLSRCRGRKWYLCVFSLGGAEISTLVVVGNILFGRGRASLVSLYRFERHSSFQSESVYPSNGCIHGQNRSSPCLSMEAGPVTFNEAIVLDREPRERCPPGHHERSVYSTFSLLAIRPWHRYKQARGDNTSNRP